MRGADRQTATMFSYASPELLVPKGHPLRAIQPLVNMALEQLSGDFDKLYSAFGRDSIAPEKLLRALLSAILVDPQVVPLLSDEHFSVDGTLIEAWASMKSFKPKDGSGEPPASGRNGEVDFRGTPRGNETHASTTDPDARLYKKAAGQASRLCHMGHVLTETRNGLVVDTAPTRLITPAIS